MFIGGEKVNKNYLITIYFRGFFSDTIVFNVSDVEGNGKFYEYKDNCFIMWGRISGKSVYYSFPLDRIKNIEIEEV